MLPDGSVPGPDVGTDRRDRLALPVTDQDVIERIAPDADEQSRIGVGDAPVGAEVVGVPVSGSTSSR